MKNMLSLFTLAFLLSCQQTRTDAFAISSEDTLTLRQLKEVQWPSAYYKPDADALDRILHDQFQMIRASGEWSDKQKELAALETLTAPDSFRFEIKRLDIFPNGTAVVAGTGNILHGNKKTTYQSSNVLIKLAGEWKAISSHVSGVKQEDGQTNQ